LLLWPIFASSNFLYRLVEEQFALIEAQVKREVQDAFSGRERKLDEAKIGHKSKSELSLRDSQIVLNKVGQLKSKLKEEKLKHEELDLVPVRDDTMSFQRSRNSVGIAKLASAPKETAKLEKRAKDNLSYSPKALTSIIPSSYSRNISWRKLTKETNPKMLRLEKSEVETDDDDDDDDDVEDAAGRRVGMISENTTRRGVAHLHMYV
jgi:hypothetical protein